jgi:hypothetical protein
MVGVYSVSSSALRCSPSALRVLSCLASVFTVELLVVLRSAHLVLDDGRKFVVIVFDMHLLASGLCVVAGERKEEERRKPGNYRHVARL